MRKQLFSLAVMLILLAVWIGSEPMLARAAGFVVNSNADDANAHDWLPGDGLCVDSQSRCTLRAAIEEANADPGTDTITFQAAMTILIDAGEGVLPSLDETATIDASGVWNTVNNAPGVTLNGGGGSFVGLYLGASSCQVYGLYITNFDGDGILVVSAANWIGGTGAGQRNVLSGNDTGISLYSSAAQNNILHNNYIGLAPAGNVKNPNDTGLYIGNGAADNIVGGNDAARVNYISGNTYNGVLIEGIGTDNNWLGGNAVGVGTDLSNLGNGAYGIRIQNGAANTVIGGASNSGNIVSYNAYSGVYVINAGGGTRITDNLISGNGSDGIEINNSTGCVVSDNMIGGNTLNGVRVVGTAAAGNLIWPNSIFGNGGKGILLQNGGNMSIAAPVISSASASGASGTVCAGCRVALYSDSGDEGQKYHDILWADGAGNWTYSGMLIGPNVTGTAIDISGNTSEFSSPYDISNTPPNTPTNTSPADGAAGVSVTTTLGWSGGDPDPGDTVTYDVYLGAANPPPLYQSDHPTTTLAPLLNPGVTFYWKIVARDNHGATTEGPVWSFTTASNTPPNTPSNPSPAHQATGVGLSPAFSWSGGDPDGDPVHYAVHGGEFSWVTSTLWYSGTVASFTLGFSFKPNTKYIWSVHANDNKGGVTVGPVWEFTTGVGYSHFVYLPAVMK